MTNERRPRMTKEEAFHILMHMEKYIAWDEDYGAAILAPLMDATAVALIALKEDAVEVVRCFSCMHWDEVEEMEGGGYCNHPRFHIDNAEPPIVQAADYCSYGERKDNG